MNIPGVHRHARLGVANVSQMQIAPAAGDLADFQPRYPAIGGIKQRVQAGSRTHQKGDGTQQQQDKNQYAEAYFLPQTHNSGPRPM